MTEKTRWFLVVVFSIAMAWLEAAVVLYLRVLHDKVQPYQQNPLPHVAIISEAELVREAATILMLFAVGCLAGRTIRSRLAYFTIAFGVWDIFYYVFLLPLTGWPKSLLDWDILFLLPMPWWGPVIAPVSIALLMIIGGTLVSQFDQPDRPLWPRRGAVVVGLLGVGLALYVFMADAIAVLGQGSDVVRHVLPTIFNWPLFGLGFVLMMLPVADVVFQKQSKE